MPLSPVSVWIHSAPHDSVPGVGHARAVQGSALQSRGALRSSLTRGALPRAHVAGTLRRLQEVSEGGGLIVSKEHPLRARQRGHEQISLFVQS
jgi:hypothetical protein